MTFILNQPFNKVTRPSGEVIYYPVIPIIFSKGNKKIPVGFALVDTGADKTLLPLAFGNEFGFKFDLEADKEIWDGAGGGKFNVYKSPEKIKLTLTATGFPPLSKEMFVHFTLEQPTILIGRDFLNMFKTTFDGPRKTLKLEN